MTDTTYPELLRDLDESARSQPPRRQLSGLYDVIAPLLDRLEEEQEELGDEDELSTPEAVRGLRRAAAGEPVDADAIHDHLTLMGLLYSEDQDPQRHVLSQSAFAAAAWLRLSEGRVLRTSIEEEDPAPAFAPSPFTRILDLLAWTRTGQVYLFWEDAAAHPALGDLPSATRELESMHRQLASDASRNPRT